MDEEQARRILRRHGWTAYTMVRPGGQYLVARRRIEGRVVSAYVAAISRLAWYSQEDIKQRLPDIA